MTPNLPPGHRETICTRGVYAMTTKIYNSTQPHGPRTAGRETPVKLALSHITQQIALVVPGEDQASALVVGPVLRQLLPPRHSAPPG